MKIPFRRFSEEFYYYSSQLVVFFIVIIFLTSGSIAMGITSSIIIVVFMIVQTFLLVSQGHLPVLRFIFSLITPLGYSILKAATSSMDFSESTNILLWSAAIYIGFFQAIAFSRKSGFIKRVAEGALSLGSGFIFFAFYYYLDMRINLRQAFESGKMDRNAYMEALKITHFASGLKAFAASPQHLFALLGIASFDIMLLAARMRTITLRSRLDRFIERPVHIEQTAFQEEEVPPLPAKAVTPSRLLISAISSDIVGFTALSEMMGAQKSVEFLNKYYALWTHVASGQGGRIMSISGDSVIILFGLVDEQLNPERALYSAYAFMDELDGFREDLAAQSLPANLKVSIGVHSGIVVSALLGPPGEQKKNVFGDTIAVAARLDSLCRELHQDLLVSHSTFRRLSLESQATLDRMGEVLLRQSTRPVPVYSRK
ncbi:MAG TPA: adenylate/guanylate cyclase domain-containing protein [Rectinemataceae bacterium]|nr:adenylate/guanylate cyclase domain-containing protein [Rectinemataceae bacterium]